MRSSVFLIIAAAAGGFASTAMHDADSTKQTYYHLEKLIVTATRRSTELSKAPSISHVVARPELENIQARRASDALKYVPGLSLESGTGSGSPFKTNVTINGMPNYYNVVMVDGMRMLTSHIQTGVNIDMIPAGAVERIEIIKDASSALYGSDALGGVVNIITRGGGAVPNASLEGAGGSNNSWMSAVSGRGSSLSGNLAYSVYASYEESDGPEIESPRHRIDHMGYRKVSSINRVNATPIPSLAISGYLHFVTDEAEFADGYERIRDTTLMSASDTTTWYEGKREYDMQTARLIMPGVETSYDFSANLTGHFLGYFTHWDGEISAELHQLGSPRISFDFSGLPGNIITAGAEYSWCNYFRSGLPDTNAQHTASAFIQDELFLFDSALTVLGALRMDYVANTKEDVKDSGPVPSPKISVLWRPLDGLSVRGTAARGFKAPTIQELYEDRFHFGTYRLGNPELKPEYSTSGAVGIEYIPFRQLALSANSYINALDDMIIIAENGKRGSFKKYDRFNLEQGIIGGADTRLAFRIGNERFGGGLEMGGSIVALFSDDDSLRIPYKPGVNAFGRLNGHAAISSSVLLSGFIGQSAALDRQYWSYKDNSISDLEDFYDLEAGFAVSLKNNARLYFRGSNLLGRKHESYEDLLMRTAGDRRFEGGLRLSLN